MTEKNDKTEKPAKLKLVTKKNDVEKIDKDIINNLLADKFMYNPDVKFTKPLAIPGSYKQFVPNPDQVFEDNPKINRFDQLADELKALEDYKAFKVIKFVDFKATEFVVKEKPSASGEVRRKIEQVIFEVEGVKYSAPVKGSFFKQYTTTMKIPTDFSAENPDDINISLFEHWSKQTPSANVPIAIYFHEGEAIKQLHQEVADDVKVLHSFTFIGDGSKVNAKQFANLKIPRIARISENLHAIKDSFKEHLDRGVRVLKYSYKNGQPVVLLGVQKEGEDDLHELYQGENYIYCIKVTGKSNSLTNIEAKMGFYRLLCSNGMGAFFDADLVKELIESVVSNNKIDDTKPEEATKKKKNVKNIVDKIKRMAKNLNSGIAGNFTKEDKMKELLASYKFCMDNIEHIQNSIQLMHTPWREDVTPERIVEVMEIEGKQVKVPGDILKYTILQFVADITKETGNEFNNAYEVQNFMTYLSKAYSFEMNDKAEGVAIPFGMGLYRQLASPDKKVSKAMAKYMKYLH